MTTATLTRPRVLFAAGAPRRGLLLGFFGTLVVSLCLLAGLSMGIGMAHEGRILPGVRVAGVEVAGLDRDGAIARLNAQLPSLTSGHATVFVGRARITVPYGEIGRAYAIETMVDEAMGVGRSGNPLADGVARLRTTVHPSEVAASVRVLDQAVLDRTASAIAERFSHDPIDATVRLDPGRGFVAVSGHDGSRLDAAAVRAALTSAIATADTADRSLTLSITPVRASVSDEQAEAVARAA